MTNADYTHLTLVVDRSGSMRSVQEEAQSGINALVAEQFALPGTLTVTLSQFDDAFDTVARMSGSCLRLRAQAARDDRAAGRRGDGGGPHR